MKRILVIEDEPQMLLGLRDNLELEGYAVETAADGDEGLQKAASFQPDLVILDVMLPRKNGFDVCRELRARSNTTPVVMLTARNQETDKVLGLELGADDYVTKPFSAREVVARIRAVLRRAEPRPAGNDGPIALGELRIDPGSRIVTAAGRTLELSRKEFEVLELLARQAGRVVSRERLLEEVWDTNWFGSTKTLDVHVSSLRRKLGDDPAAPRYLHTVRGVGFRLSAPQDEA